MSRRGFDIYDEEYYKHTTHEGRAVTRALLIIANELVELNEHLANLQVVAAETPGKTGVKPTPKQPDGWVLVESPNSISESFPRKLVRMVHPGEAKTYDSAEEAVLDAFQHGTDPDDIDVDNGRQIISGKAFL